MSKKEIYEFSLGVKKLIADQNMAIVEKKIKDANLSQEELEFLFMCLRTEGYDPKTDRFLVFESDNSAFLQLVNLVQSNIKDKK